METIYYIKILWLLKWAAIIAGAYNLLNFYSTARIFGLSPVGVGRVSHKRVHFLKLTINYNGYKFYILVVLSIG